MHGRPHRPRAGLRVFDGPITNVRGHMATTRHGTHDAVGEGANDEALLAAIAFVVDRDDFTRLTTAETMRRVAHPAV